MRPRATYKNAPSAPMLADQVSQSLPSRLRLRGDQWPTGQAPRLSVGDDTDIFLDRWSSVSDESFEIEIGPCWEEHVFSMPLRRSTVVYKIGNRLITDSEIPPGRQFLNGPVSTYSRKVQIGGSQVFCLSISSKVLRERLCLGSDVGLDGQVHLFGPHVSSDRIVRELLIAGAEAAGDNDELCLESIGLALAKYAAVRFVRGARIRRISPLSKARLKRVVDYIEEHLAQPITLAELSAMAGLSRPHFGAQFKAATGRTPYSYIMYRRYCASQSMLLRRDLSINEVALATGFKNPAQFIAFFRKYGGQTPSRWRRASAFARSRTIS